jgi:hypothetical protein
MKIHRAPEVVRTGCGLDPGVIRPTNAPLFRQPAPLRSTGRSEQTLVGSDCPNTSDMGNAAALVKPYVASIQKPQRQEILLHRSKPGRCPRRSLQ